MCGFSIYLIAIVLGAVLEVNLVGSIALHKHLDHSRSNEVNLLNDKCSAFSGVLPDPKSGCCGHIEDAVKNAINGHNKYSTDDPDSELDGGTKSIVDEIKANCIDIGGIIKDVVNNVIDSVKERVTTWISKFSEKKAEEVVSLSNEEKTFNEKTYDYNSNLPVLSSTSAVRIVSDGERAGLRQYPWLVRFTVAMGNGMAMICGGSLISPRFVLTAADCVNNTKSLDDINIYLGEHKATASSDCLGDTCMEKVAVHPDNIVIHEGFGYKSNGLVNDIALLRLKEAAPYTDYIRPICLPAFNIDVPRNEGTPLEVAVWDSAENETSSINQAPQVQLGTQEQCKKYYDTLSPKQICAVGRTGQDTCRGVSGSPLMMEKDGSFYLVGIVSRKELLSSCGSSKPGFHTNVFAYTRWILDNMNI